MPPLPVPAVALEDDALCVRRWRTGDAVALHDAVRESVASVGRWLDWCRADYDLAAAHGWIAHCEQGWQRGSDGLFAIVHGGRLVGGCGLDRIDRAQQRANLGYWLRTTAQGLGLAPRAARLAATFGFRDLGLDAIDIVIAAANVASRRTAERIGARLDPDAEVHAVVGGKTVPALCYVLRCEWLVAAGGAASGGG